MRHSYCLSIFVFDAEVVFIEIIKNILRWVIYVGDWNCNVFVICCLVVSGYNKGATRFLIDLEWALFTLPLLLDLLRLLFSDRLLLYGLCDLWHLFSHLLLVNLLEEVDRKVAPLVKGHKALVWFLWDCLLKTGEAGNAFLLLDGTCVDFAGDLHLCLTWLEYDWLSWKLFWGQE